MKKHYKEIESKLRFVSKIQVGEKIDINSLQVVSALSWGTSLYRTIYARNESRYSTLNWLSQLFNDAFELSKFYLSKKDEFCKIIGNTLLKIIKDCIVGITNLSKTYEDDRYFCFRN